MKLRNPTLTELFDSLDGYRKAIQMILKGEGGGDIKEFRRALQDVKNALRKIHPDLVEDLYGDFDGDGE